MLLPPGSWTMIEFGYKWGDIFRTLPFDWDAGSRRLKLAKSWVKLTCWLLTNVYLLIAVGSVGFWRLFQRWDTVAMRNNPTIQIHSLLTVIVNAVFVQYQICLMLVYRDVPRAWNAFMDYTLKFQQKYERVDRGKAPAARRKWLLNVFKTNIFLVHLTYLAQVAYISVSPDHIGYFDLSLLREWVGIGTISWGRVSLDGVVCSLVVGILWDIVVASQLYFWGIGVLPLPYFLEVLVMESSQERENRSQFRTRPELRLPGPFHKVSREVVILTSLLRDIASPMLVVLPISLMVGMVLSGVQAVKDENLMNMSVQLLAFSQSSVLFILLNRLGGTFSEIFSKSVRYFITHNKDPYWIKSVKALKAPTFRVYGTYTLGNNLIVEGFQIVFDYIVTCLALVKT